MSLPETLLTVSSGVVAAGLQAVGFAVIAPAIQRREARPNCCSWLIWSVVAALAAVGSWQAGATWPLAGAAMNALGCVLCSSVPAPRAVRRQSRRPELSRCGDCRDRRLADHQRTGGGLVLFLSPMPAVPSDHTQRRDRPTLRERAGLGAARAAGGAAVLSVEPQQWVWSWGGFGHWGGAVYVALVNAAVAASIFSPGCFECDGRFRRAASPG